ncbi:sugar phosphate isomerase/epimerase [bacterium]|nr:sugar phosphate isomerase/epimerase [bacterium]
MENSISVVSVHLNFSSLEEAFQKAKEFGIDSIEWFDANGEFLTLDRIKRIVEFAKEFNIRTSYHAPYIGKWDLGTQSPENISQRLEEILEYAVKLSADLITLHMGSYLFEETREYGVRKVVGEISKVSKHAENFGIYLCVENSTTCHNKNEIGTQTEDFLYLFDKVKSPAIGMTLDVGHAHITKNLFKLLECFNHKIHNIHLHDNNGIEDQHLPPGKGTIPWDDFFSALSEINYKGTFTLEFPEDKTQFLSFIKRIRKFTRRKKL